MGCFFLKKLDIGVVGVGAIGSKHVELARTMGNLVAICDVKKKSYPFYQYYSLDAMLAKEQLDMVSVCTPNGLHAEHVIKALDSGCHVLCEKPMALSSVDCGRMIHAAEKANRRLFVVKQNRFNPPVTVVKQALDAGWLGRLLDVQVNCFWNRNKEYYSKSDWRGTILDGGVLFTQYSHFIDLLLWFVGDVKDVFGHAEKQMHSFPDTGVVLFRSMGGVMGTLNFTINSYGKNMEGSITLFGEKGTVKIGGEYLNRLEYQSIDGHVLVVPDEPLMGNRYGVNRGTSSNHDKVYRNVIDVLSGKGSIVTDMLDGLRTVEFIERVYEI